MENSITLPSMKIRVVSGVILAVLLIIIAFSIELTYFRLHLFMLTPIFWHLHLLSSLRSSSGSQTTRGSAIFAD